MAMIVGSRGGATGDGKGWVRVQGLGSWVSYKPFASGGGHASNDGRQASRAMCRYITHTHTHTHSLMPCNANASLV